VATRPAPNPVHISVSLSRICNFRSTQSGSGSGSELVASGVKPAKSFGRGGSSTYVWVAPTCRHSFSSTRPLAVLLPDSPPLSPLLQHSRAPTMSELPPWYRREPEESDTTPLFKGQPDQHPLGGEGDIESRGSSNAYPPPLPLADLDDGGPPRPKILYTWHPRYPIRGDEQNATGILGRTKQVSLFSRSPMWAFTPCVSLTPRKQSTLYSAAFPCCASDPRTGSSFCNRCTINGR
jgi:hypothetical protein